MRSKNDENEINQGKSIRFFEGVIENNGWKYRRLEKDNDIDGEIEVFSQDRETTANFIKVQLKSTTNMKYENNKVKFNAPVKFMNFCDVCDIPTIIVLYDVEQERAFWLWTQKYITQTLDNTNPKWRNNLSEVTIYIPMSNEVSETREFYNELESISKIGINEIQQLRKRDTSEYYFTLLEEKDNSSGSIKRMSVKAYIERSFATSKDSMVELIKKINHKIKNHYYYKGIWQEKKNAQEPDYIWLLFYDDLIQFEYGLPFCRTEWINDKDSFPIVLKEYDQLINEHNIRIKWEHNRSLNEYLLQNTNSKREYINQIKVVLDFAIEELKILPSLFWEKDKNNFYSHINQKTNDYRSYFVSVGDIIPPYECERLHTELENVLVVIDNLAIEINNGQLNERYLQHQYISKLFPLSVILRNEIEQIK